MGSSKKITVGYRYHMGLHMGLCHEPDALLEIMAGDRTAWIGQVTESTTIQINAPKLFGGDEREGGIAGTCDVMMGRPDQLPNAYLAEHQGTPQPAYRGFLGLVYRGLIASNNPYIKNWAVRVRSVLRGWHGGEPWYPERAAVELMDGSVVMHGPGWEYQVEHFSEPNTGWNNFTVPVDGWQQGGELPYNTGTGEYWTPMRSNLWLRRRITVYGRGLTLNIGAENGCVVWINGENVGTSNPDNAPIPNNQENPVSYFLGESGNLDVVVKAFAEIDAGNDAGNQVVMDFTGTAMQGMNPAHIIYQALTDPDWGMGYPAATIDDASFRDAADRLHSEGLGLCMKWNSQTTIQEFTQIIADHASLVYGQDRRTGLFRMRLLRQDYNEADLPVFTSRDVKVIRYQRPSLADTVNEVIIQYTDPTTGDDATTAPLQNLANIQGQGRVVSQTLSFPGIVTQSLAARVGMRELQARSTPLWRFSLEANRRMAVLLPGEPFVLDLLDTDIGVRLVMRAGELDYGETADAVVRAECVEDVFGMPATTYVGDPGPGGEVPSTKPRPANATAFEVPYRELVQVLDPPALAALPQDAGYVAAVAAKPAGAPINYGLFTRLPPAAFDEATAGDFAPFALLAAPIGKLDTVLEFGSASGLASLEVGQGIFIGEGPGAEMVRVDAIDLEEGTMTVGRGCGDTVPHEWPAGSRLWGFDEASAGDPVQYVDGELVEAKVAPRSASGELPLAQAPTHSVTIASRQARPYPPGRFRINGDDYPPDATGPTPLRLTWEPRDRVLQADTLVDTTEAGTGEEPGTTYVVRGYENGVLTHTEDSIALHLADWTPTQSATIRVELGAVRDGLESYQVHDHTLEWTASMPDDVVAGNILDKVKHWWALGAFDYDNFYRDQHGGTDLRAFANAGSGITNARPSLRTGGGQATRFTGSGGAFVHGNPAWMLKDFSLSVVAWVMPQAGAIGSTRTILKDAGNTDQGSPGSNITVQTYVVADTPELFAAAVFWEYGTGSDYNPFTPIYDVPGGAPFMYSMNRDMAVNGVTVGVNSTIIQGTTIEHAPEGGTADNCKISVGSRPGTSAQDTNAAGDVLDGDLQDVAMFQPALNADEVYWLHNGGAGRSYADLYAIAGRARPWTPAQLARKVVWIVADDDCNTVAGGFVTALNNRAGFMPGTPYGNNAANQGLHGVEALNGRPVISATTAKRAGFIFPNTQYDRFRSVAGITTVAVTKRASPPSSVGTILMVPRESSNGFLAGLSHHPGPGTPLVGFRGGGRRVNADAFAGIYSTTDQAGRWVIAGAANLYGTGEAILREDGQETVRETIFSTGTTSSTTNRGNPCGMGITGWGSEENADYAIAEGFIFDGLLTADEWEKLEGYLAHRWGLADSLPPAHPYKASPPML